MNPPISHPSPAAQNAERPTPDANPHVIPDDKAIRHYLAHLAQHCDVKMGMDQWSDFVNRSLSVLDANVALRESNRVKDAALTEIANLQSTWPQWDFQDLYQSCRDMAKCALKESAPATISAEADEERPEKCEGCKKPATTSDSEGIPLCAECAKDLDEETLRAELAELREDRARLDWAVNHPMEFDERISDIKWTCELADNEVRWRAAIDRARGKGAMP